MKNKNIAIISMLSAVAIVINFVENWFIPPVGFGIRFGLANVISLISLFLFGPKSMIVVVMLRLTLGNLLKGTIFGTPFIISASGLILSSIIIFVLYKLKSSIIFISFMSSVFHTTGQVIAVSILYSQINILAILPLLIIFSLATGMLTGYISSLIIKRFKK